MENLYHNYKDLFRAPRISIGPQRIFIATIGLIGAHLIYILFTFAALIINGFSISSVWSQYGLFPCVYPYDVSAISHIIYGLGFIIALYIVLMTNTAVSRASYMFVRENLFYTYKQAITFTLKKYKSVGGVYVTYIFLIVPFIIGAIVMAAIGKIPWFGEILNAFATLPYIFAGMLLVFFTLSLLISLFFGPTIIATSEEDGFGAAIQSLHLTWGQPWRLVLYGLITCGLVIFALFFFAFILKIGLIIYSILFMPLMHSLAPILDTALYFVQVSMGKLDALIRELIGPTGSRVFYLKKVYDVVNIGLSTQLAAYITYIFLLLAAYMTAGYGLAVANTAHVLSYIIFDKKLTNTDLLKRRDSEIESDKDKEEPKIESGTEDVKELKTEDTEAKDTSANENDQDI